MSRWASVIILLAAAVGGGACAGPAVPNPAAPATDAALDAGWLLAEVRALTVEEMAGRAAGTPGADRAARHIARVFSEAGLRPGGEDGYFQWLEVITGVRLGEPTRLRVRRGDLLLDYAVGESFIPFRFSESGRVEGEVVFAGYGITAPDLSYDDYAHLNVTGKIVLVLTHEPRERDQASPFRKPEAFHYTELRHKVINAREHGARAIIIVTDELGHAGEPERLTPIRGSGGAQWGIVAVHASRRVAGALLTGSGTTLARLQREIDERLEPRSRPLPGGTVDLEIGRVRQVDPFTHVPQHLIG
jgi:hypothetical protein